MNRQKVFVAAIAALAVAAVSAVSAAPATAATRTMPHIEIGIPGEDIGSQQDAGAVEVRHSGGVTKLLQAPDHQAGDRFGTATIAFDVDRDNRQDLFVGAPGKDVGGRSDAGAIYVYRGTASGFVPWKTLTMDSLGVEGGSQAGAGFGSSLSRDWRQGDNPSYKWFAAGAPRYDTGGAVDAGAVVEIGIGQGTAPTFGGTLWTAADWPDGTSEAGDRFGTALGWYSLQGAAGDASSYILIGSPGEDTGTAADAGMVNVLHDASTDSYTDARLGGTNERGDRFGAALYGRDAQLVTAAIGIPGENGGSGVVKPVFPIKTTWWQAGDPREAGDGYGSFVEGST